MYQQWHCSELPTSWKGHGGTQHQMLASVMTQSLLLLSNRKIRHHLVNVKASRRTQDNLEAKVSSATWEPLSTSGTIFPSACAPEAVLGVLEFLWQWCWGHTGPELTGKIDQEPRPASRRRKPAGPRQNRGSSAPGVFLTRARQMFWGTAEVHPAGDMAGPVPREVLNPVWTHWPSLFWGDHCSFEGRNWII